MHILVSVKVAPKTTVSNRSRDVTMTLRITQETNKTFPCVQLIDGKGSGFTKMKNVILSLKDKTFPCVQLIDGKGSGFTKMKNVILSLKDKV